MAGMIRNIQHEIEYLFIRALILVLNVLPVQAALRFGDVVGFIAFSILRIRRRVSLVNLRRSFGDKYSAREYRRIALGSYINFARSMIEFGLAPKLARMNLATFCKTAGQEALTERIRPDQGFVALSGHFGNFELIGSYLTYTGRPVDFLVGVQHNPYINRLMNRHREAFGVGLIEIGVAARGVIRALKQGRVVAFLSDQDAGSDGTVVDFLGRPASTPKGAAAFALKTGCPILFGVDVRNGLRGHTFHFEGPLWGSVTDDKEDDIRRLTQSYTDILEKYIELYPDHYFWAHRRWKSTCAEDYAKPHK